MKIFTCCFYRTTGLRVQSQGAREKLSIHPSIHASTGSQFLPFITIFHLYLWYFIHPEIYRVQLIKSPCIHLNHHCIQRWSQEEYSASGRQGYSHHTVHINQLISRWVKPWHRTILKSRASPLLDHNLNEEEAGSLPAVDLCCFLSSDATQKAARCAGRVSCVR